MKLKVSYNIIKLEIPAHFLILTILSQGSIFWVQNLFSYFLEKENFSHVCAGTTTCEKIVQKIIKIVEKVFLIANDVRKLCKKDLKLLKHSIFGYKFWGPFHKINQPNHKSRFSFKDFTGRLLLFDLKIDPVTAQHIFYLTAKWKLKISIFCFFYNRKCEKGVMSGPYNKKCIFKKSQCMFLFTSVTLSEKKHLKF